MNVNEAGHEGVTDALGLSPTFAIHEVMTTPEDILVPDLVECADVSECDCREVEAAIEG